MKRALLVVLALIIGAAFGVGSGFVVLDNGQLLGRTNHDYWFGNRNAGSVAADPYTRGIVAKIGLLALNRSESIYFHRYKDENGRQLREGCAYELTGGDLPTRWWSITAYADDDFLPVNGQRAFSADATQMVRGEDGRWVVRMAADRADAANWISTENAGDFSLALRMYNPDESARADESTIAFPTIRTITCGEDAP